MSRTEEKVHRGLTIPMLNLVWMVFLIWICKIAFYGVYFCVCQLKIWSIDFVNVNESMSQRLPCLRPCYAPSWTKNESIASLSSAHPMKVRNVLLSLNFRWNILALVPIYDKLMKIVWILIDECVVQGRGHEDLWIKRTHALLFLLLVENIDGQLITASDVNIIGR